MSELVQKAMGGETRLITVRGKPVARITALEQPRERIGVEALRRLTDGRSDPEVSSGEWITAMRDRAHY